MGRKKCYLAKSNELRWEQFSFNDKPFPTSIPAAQAWAQITFHGSFLESSPIMPSPRCGPCKEQIFECMENLFPDCLLVRILVRPLLDQFKSGGQVPWRCPFLSPCPCGGMDPTCVEPMAAAQILNARPEKGCCNHFRFAVTARYCCFYFAMTAHECLLPLTKPKKKCGCDVPDEIIALIFATVFVWWWIYCLTG